MDDNTIISVDNVSIRFNLSKERLDSLKEFIIKKLKGQVEYDEFWALENINLNIKRGDSIGLVGFNGSGKSTLLKTIAGVLKPTKGKVTVRGTMAPLIELGAGLDYDLTARENVFLCGSILGYSRKEMMNYYDNIVEFSELAEFMDVPMKNFSSGMVARLAFAINTIGKPDILIVDEVLSVGDFRFQEKCEQRIQSMIDTNTTILFVSHSIEQVQKLCKTAVWIEKGHIKKIGPANEIAEEYSESVR